MKRWLIAILLITIPAIALANWLYLPGPGYSKSTSAGLQEIGTAQFVSTSGGSVTVPSGASLAIVGASYYGGSSSIDFSSITLGGSSFTKKASVYGADDAQAVLYVLSSPTAGSQTLNFTLSAGVSEGPAIWIAFFSGVSATLDGTGGQQKVDGSDVTTGSMSANTGDLVFAVCEQYDSGCGTGDQISMTGVTERSNNCYNKARISYGWIKATGTTTVTCNKGSGSSYIVVLGGVFNAQ